MLEVKKSYLKLTLIGLLLFMAMIFGLYVYQFTHPSKVDEKQLMHATYIQPGRALSPFQLQLTDGTILSPASMIGHWTILFFGYTQCRSICPVTMDMLHHVFQQLRQQGMRTLPEMIMISLDGQRDSLETMKQYVQGFDQDFKGAIGSIKTIQELTQQLGVVYDSQSEHSDGQIDHSGSLTIISPAGEVVAFFLPPMQTADVSKDLKTMMSALKIKTF